MNVCLMMSVKIKHLLFKDFIGYMYARRKLDRNLTVNTKYCIFVIVCVKYKISVEERYMVKASSEVVLERPLICIYMYHCYPIRT